MKSWSGRVCLLRNTHTIKYSFRSLFTFEIISLEYLNLGSHPRVGQKISFFKQNFKFFYQNNIVFHKVFFLKLR